MADEGGYGGVLDGGVSRARFLKLAGLGAGLSLFSGSLFPAGPGLAQAVGGPEILHPDAPYPVAAWWPPPPVDNDPNDPTFDERKTNELYKQLADAGFNTILGGNGVGNKRANRLALAACVANNLRLVLEDSKLRNAINPIPPSNTARSAGQEEPESVMQALTEQDSQQEVGARAAIDRQAAVAQRIGELKAELNENPENLPALAGILLYDEPGRSLFPLLKFAKGEVKRVFGDGELPYVNVWPSHASTENALEAASYTNYLEKYINKRRYPNAVAPPMLSFDHYPLLAGEKTTPDFFYNHAVIRNFAKRFGAPSWGFVQSMGFDGRNIGLGVRRPPDEAEIFWQINVALAYGVKGIQYFTYWTPEDDEKVNFGRALITRQGVRTPLYDYATEANGFLQRAGGVLRPLDSEFVTHFGERRMPRGARPFKGYPSYVKAASGDAAILGLFREPDTSAERYLLVVNRSPNRASRTRLTISGTVRGVDEFDPSIDPSGQFVPRPLAGDPPRFLTVSLGAGRARLYRLRTA